MPLYALKSGTRPSPRQVQKPAACRNGTIRTWPDQTYERGWIAGEREKVSKVVHAKLL